MKLKLSGISRIQIGLVTLCLTAVLLANALGLIPDPRAIDSRNRAKLCEAVATSVIYLVSHGKIQQADAELDFFRSRNPDVVSIGLRRTDGELLADAGDHEHVWTQRMSAKSDGCYVVPISGDAGKWGEMEIRFEPLYTGIAAYVNPSLAKLLLLFVPVVAILSRLHLQRLLQHLDPSRVVPSRVRQTLDNFAEGVMLLDNDNRIVLANETLASQVKLSPNELVGRMASDLPWVAPADDSNAEFPWQITRKTNEPVRGASLKLKDNERAHTAVFSVNSVPVFDDNGRYQGAMAAFADVSTLERKRSELATAMDALRKSRDEIRMQNEELRYLVTRDPLTACLNRRTFFEKFEAAWNAARGGNGRLCCVMVDIDFFKSINDNFGHSTGDEVLRKTGAKLLDLANPGDVVCRYGGEEFCVIMPSLQPDEAVDAAERIRTALSELTFPEFSITASLGVASIEQGAADAQQLLDQADKSLYVAKRNGRNQVVSWDALPDDLEVDEASISRTPTQAEADDAISIPYCAVSALVASLTYRDPETGAHSARVADLSGLLAQQATTRRDAYTIEVAGLLHDIGKVGVPDAILLKPGPLTEDEWKIMSRHDRIGVELINSSFRCPPLTEIVQHHHRWYDGSRGKPDGPRGDAIPLGSRIISIADAFDAMVSDRPYRKGLSVDEALAELLRCAGTQFDPKLVDAFCDLMVSHSSDFRFPPDGVSQDRLLSIGRQIERIVDVLEDDNREAFVALTDRLRSTAEQARLHHVARAASQASQRAEARDDLGEVLAEAHQLLDVCRAFSASSTDSASPSAPDESSERPRMPKIVL